MALPLLEVLRRSTAYLAARGDETPRLDSELLLCSVLRLRRLDLYLQFERPLDDAELTGVRRLVRRRAEGCPTAHLVGEREFMGLTLTVSPAALIPRPETELLVERALELLADRDPRRPAPRVADLGTGSGCIAVAIAHHHPACTVDAVDRSAAALRVARANVARHRLGDRVWCGQGDWTAPLRGRGPYDLVVGNPPYVTSDEMGGLPRTVAAYEPAAALDGGVDGLAPHRAILGGLDALLAPLATVLLEVDPRRAERLAALVSAQWPQALCRIRPDLAGRARVVEAGPQPGIAARLGRAASGS